MRGVRLAKYAWRLCTLRNMPEQNPTTRDFTCSGRERVIKGAAALTTQSPVMELLMKRLRQTAILSRQEYKVDMPKLRTAGNRQN